MSYTVRDGVYFLDERLSNIEKRILETCGSFLEKRGFKYLSIPTAIRWETFERQQLNLEKYILNIDTDHCLAGSAEQGILERFIDQEVVESFYYARNQCFRNEFEYRDLYRVKEFSKVEQFAFCHQDTADTTFNMLLQNATDFLTLLDVQYRVVDVTDRDPGYHVKKFDVEILTRDYGWMETHSCSYFGTEQTRRFNIRGADHSVSNTGIASPRILIPFLEDENKILSF